MRVRVRSPIGSAVVRWCGDPGKADGCHHVEWTVDEDIRWGFNTMPATMAEPGLGEDSDRVILRGRLTLTEDGAAVLDLDHWQILFDLADPLPADTHDIWVEIRVGGDQIALLPYHI